MLRFFRVMFFVISVAAPATIFAADPSHPISDPLDGMQFSGLTGEKGKGDDHEDTITFRNGIFRSLDCESWGFGPATYTVVKMGTAYHFESTLTSADRGTLKWTGKIIGDKATATFRWVHERWYWSIDRDYWFEGTRQAQSR